MILREARGFCAKGAASLLPVAAWVGGWALE